MHKNRSGFVTSVCGVVATLLSLSSPAAQALEFQAHGNTIYAVGVIKPGDEFKFKDFFNSLPKGSAKIVDLASPGGFIMPALEIARLIRADGLTTYVDASRSLCASACTVLFAGGTQRHYVNAPGQAGQPKAGTVLRGLGFHEGGSPLSQAADHYSGQASAMVIDAFYELGVPGAADFVTKASPRQIMLLDGETARRIGFATSLAKP